MVAWPLAKIQPPNNITIIAGTRGLTTAPTRLVDIGSSDGTEPPRIVPGARCLDHENPGYIALSYCNGLVPPSPPWRLTTHTKAMFEERLPLHLFPQTLQDAMEWTRRLGDRFIWIDNLCIIQDSTEDWTREAARMASIYGSATVTLVAAAGSIYGGMTDRRNPLRNSACRLNPRTEAAETATQVFLLPSGQKGLFQEAIPTESRGWCHQEDILSPRLVRFSLKNVDWQCLGDRARLSRAQGLARLDGHKAHQRYLLWYAFIECYSNKQLSFPEDKLTAFSGIAAMKTTGGTYVAGICKDDVWAGLLWARDDLQLFKNPGHRYSEFVAPSWSWASLDVPVLFHEAKNRALGKIQYDSATWDPRLHNLAAEQTTFNSTGPVRNGILDLSAYAITARTSLVRPDVFPVNGSQQVSGRQRLFSPTTELLVGEVIYDCASEAREGEVLRCLVLHVADINHRNQTGVAALGIALQAFRRIGYVQFTPIFSELAKYGRFRII